MEHEPMSRFEWERVLRRASLPPATKLVGFVLATYANKTGGSIRPGVQRLVDVTRQSRRTVMRALEHLRKVGLVERTFKGSSGGRRALADEYRLTCPVDLLDRMDLLTPNDQVPTGTPDRQQEQGADMAPDPWDSDPDPWAS
jgi:hypothetical protein